MTSRQGMGKTITFILKCTVSRQNYFLKKICKFMLTGHWAAGMLWLWYDLCFDIIRKLDGSRFFSYTLFAGLVWNYRGRNPHPPRRPQDRLQDQLQQPRPGHRCHLCHGFQGIGIAGHRHRGRMQPASALRHPASPGCRITWEKLASYRDFDVSQLCQSGIGISASRALRYRW